MDRFIYDSKEFWDQLQNDPHQAGEIEYLRSIARPGMHVIDVGANRGVTTVALAANVAPEGRVYAFEPVPEYFDLLKENLSRNEIENVSAFNLALSNQNGRIRFYKHGEGSGIAPAQDAEMLWVEATTIADFLQDHSIGRTDLLNLDCEGSELVVLQGARPILEQQAPQIFCEIHHASLHQLGQSTDDLTRLLRSFGFDLRPLEVEDLDAERGFENCSHIYARRRPEDSRVERLKRAIADLKGRMPAHSVKPSMFEDLEELEEQLKAAQENS